MNLFSIAEKLAQDNSAIAFDAAKCARRIDRFSKCEICLRACPSAAIRMDKQIEFDSKACVSCGVCLHLCPLGAFSGADQAIELFDCVPRLQTKRVIQLICPRNPAPEMGPSGVDSAVRLSGCLASFGKSVYLWLLAEGVNQIVVRLDTCESCDIGKVQPEIAQTIEGVRSILKTREQAGRIVVAKERRDDFKPTTVYDSREPPLSRRDLFRSLAAQAPRVATKVMPMIDTQTTKAKRPPLERRRLINVLKRIPVEEQESMPLASDPVSGVVRKSVHQKCTACGACARVCPTGALQFVGGETEFRLTFSAGACTDCGACLDVCRPGALARDGLPTLGQFIATEPIALLTGELRICDKCGARFAGEPTAKYCPICDFRQQNPFGSVKPEDMLHLRT